MITVQLYRPLIKYWADCRSGRNTFIPSLNTLGQEQKQYDVGGIIRSMYSLNPAFVTRVKIAPR